MNEKRGGQHLMDYIIGVIVLVLGCYGIVWARHKARPMPVFSPSPSREIHPVPRQAYRMVTEEYRMRYRAWIPSQESYPVFIPASVDPSVDALCPQVYQDIVETLKKKEKDLL